MSEDGGARRGLDQNPERERDRARIAELEHRVAETDALYRATPVAFCVVDREYRFLRVNDEYCQAVERRADDIIGRSMREVIRESSADLAIGMARGVFASGQPLRNLEMPILIQAEPRIERVWLINAHPVKTDGEVSAVICVMQNVTELKQIERAARERLDVIDTLYRNAPIGLAYVGPDLRYERVNEIVAEINGIPVEAHIGKTLQEIHPRLGSGPERALHGLISRGESVRDLEIEANPPYDPDRTHVYRVSLEPLAHDDGSPRGILGTVLDVTERAGAEKELKAAHLRIAEHLRELETLYQHTPLAICYVDRDLRILRGNRVLAHAFGLSVEEMIGRNIRELTPALQAQFDPPIQRLLETGQQQLNTEIRGAPPRRPDRDYTWIMSLHPTFAEGGRVNGMILTAQDVTQLKRQQAELEDVKARLEDAQRITRVGSWEWDLLDDTVWWSDELYQIFGKSPDRFEPTWNNFIEFVHPDDISKLRGQIQATLERDEPYWLEVRVRLDDLSERTLHSAARLERTSDGRPERLIGTCQEVLPGNSPPPSRRRAARAPRR
jgi:PAS domain S-box-containing protein